MSALEKQFQQELIKRCEEAGKTCSAYRGVRFLQNVEKFGGVKTAQEIMRRGRMSDGFEALAQAGLLKLSMEAVVIDAKYGALFTDDEVNSCYELLCEQGYY
ncbi:MAG: hypothetical protein ACRCW2_00975 [Cellulosilyticaceae bacterium]